MNLRPESGRVSQEPTSHEADQIFPSSLPKSGIENDRSACVGSIGTRSTDWEFSLCKLLHLSVASEDLAGPELWGNPTNLIS